MQSRSYESLHSYPVLRADAIVRVADDHKVKIEIEDDVYTLSRLESCSLAKALNLLTGVHSLPDVSKAAGIPLSDLNAVVTHLSAAGVVNNEPAGDTWIEPGEFAQLCRAMYRPWKARLFNHDLWRGLVEGTLNRRVFIGWAVESYWFIEGVLDRLPLAAACSENAKLRCVFTQHFSEEWDHFNFFVRTLDALGITAEQRRVGQPLPGTRAVLHWMRDAARRDSLRYAACSGFLESTGNDRAAARSFFDHVAMHYDTPDRVAVTPMAEHVSLDEDYGHNTMVENAANCFPSISQERCQQALQSTYGLLETLEMWSSDILRYYAASSSLPVTSPRIYRGEKF